MTNHPLARWEHGVSVGLRVTTRTGKPACRKWVVFFCGEEVSRHRWRENADQRAAVMKDAIVNGTAPEALRAKAAAYARSEQVSA